MLLWLSRISSTNLSSSLWWSAKIAIGAFLFLDIVNSQTKPLMVHARSINATSKKVSKQSGAGRSNHHNLRRGVGNRANATAVVAIHKNAERQGGSVRRDGPADREGFWRQDGHADADAVGLRYRADAHAGKGNSGAALSFSRRGSSMTKRCRVPAWYQLAEVRSPLPHGRGSEVLNGATSGFPGFLFLLLSRPDRASAYSRRSASAFHRARGGLRLR